MPNWTPRDTGRARELRNNATPAERLLWQYLRKRRLGEKFSRQMQIGRVFPDFLCRELGLIVECDGISHDREPERDARRDAWLRGQGYTVLRFPNAAVLGNIEGVVRAVELEVERLREMDAAGVDMQLMSVTIPGVQMFAPDRADAMAISTNDQLAAAIARHPTRFAGLACFAPQSPRAAAKEMERAITKLKLNGFIVNSHTNDLYLDDPRFAPVLEAAEALGRPIYLHPRAPSNGMAAPFRDYVLGGSIWGFGMEAGTHAVRLMLSGTFDRYPKLRIVLGHMGEALPFWMWRLDHMYKRRAKDGRLKPTSLMPSEYFRRNFAVTTSGFEAADVLDLVIGHAGIDNVMWAIDYPYESSLDAAAFIDRAKLTTSQRASICHTNAERLFHIAAR